jgi:hypothetical protein
MRQSYGILRFIAELVLFVQGRSRILSTPRACCPKSPVKASFLWTHLSVTHIATRLRPRPPEPQHRKYPMRIRVASALYLTTGDSSVSFFLMLLTRLHYPPRGLGIFYPVLLNTHDGVHAIMKINKRLSKTDTTQRFPPRRIALSRLPTRALISANPCSSECNLRPGRYLQRQAWVLFGARGPPRRVQ